MGACARVCARGCVRAGVCSWVCARGCVRVGACARVCARGCARGCVCVRMLHNHAGQMAEKSLYRHRCAIVVSMQTEHRKSNVHVCVCDCVRANA